MNVLYLTNIPSPYRVDFFNELGRNINLTVLYERKSAIDRNKKWINEKQRTFKEVFLNGINFGSDSALCINVLKYLTNNDFDIIIVGGFGTLTGMLAINYLKWKKIPFVLNVDGGFLKTENKLKYYLKKLHISKAYAWLSPSKLSDTYLINYGAKKESIYRYPFTSIYSNDILCSIPTSEEQLELRKNLNMNEDKIILSVGRFIYSKGFDFLLRSSRNFYGNIGIYIIGGKPLEEYLDIIEEYNLKNIHFVDFMDKNLLNEYFKAADLFALPTRSDVWGLVINEAMAKGLPIITTDKCVAGLELIEDDKNGYIIPVDDENGLGESINKVLSNNLLRESMGAANLAEIQKFTIETMAKRHLNIFNEIIKDMKKNE